MVSGIQKWHLGILITATNKRRLLRAVANQSDACDNFACIIHHHINARFSWIHVIKLDTKADILVPFLAIEYIQSCIQSQWYKHLSHVHDGVITSMQSTC